MNKEIVIETIRGWIDSCITREQLQVCYIAVQDMVWTRYSDDEAVSQLRALIHLKSQYILKTKSRA